MDFIQLPYPPVPFYSQRVTLDGADYTLKFEWNMRNGWFMGLSDASEEVIFEPKKLVVDWDLLRNVTDERKPPGALVLFDSSYQGLDPGYEELDQRCVLTYIPLAQAEEIRATPDEEG